MKIVIVGSGGRLGAALMRDYQRKFDVLGFSHAQLDIANSTHIRHNLGALDFDVLVNAAALTNVDLCEKEPALAFRINREAPRVLAEICQANNAKMIHFSTDYVFDGTKREPYDEDDPARPISVYGESKRAGEECVLKTDHRHLVVRVAWVFGPDRPSFVDSMIAQARESEQVSAVSDKISTPTYTRDIAEMLKRIVAGVSDPCYSGILHFTNTGSCSWQEYAQHALDCCREFNVPLKGTNVRPLKLSDMKNFVARRPVNSVLSTAKYNAIASMSPRDWRDAVAEYVRDFVAR
jgi:dTDP-4-dehydrorhamnose reductase